MKLKYDDTLSNFAFNFNLRPYTKELLTFFIAEKNKVGSTVHVDPGLTLL